MPRTEKLSQQHFFFISLVLHIVIAGIFFSLNLKSNKITEKQNIEIVLNESKSKKVHPLISSGKGKQDSSKKHTTSVKKSNSEKARTQSSWLFSKYDKESLIESASGGIGHGSNRDNPDEEWGTNEAPFEKIKDYGFYEKLYQQIDGYLAYPAVLARNKISGDINARLVFDSDGSCLWKLTKISGSEDYLRLYILETLKKTCKSNFKKYLNKRLITNADLSFRFKLAEKSETEDEMDKEKIIVGNVLLFQRSAQHSLAEWKLGPFRGMFPIPAVYLNFEWIQDNWDKLIEKKDPLVEFKKQFGGA